MKKQPNWWQIIAVLVGILSPITVGLIAMARDVSTLQVRVGNVESVQDKGFEKLNTKMDETSKDIRFIMVNMEKKADRPAH